MTQNKTELQKAYDDIIGLSGATYNHVGKANEEHAVVLVRHMSTILEAIKAAQAYADLPEMIEGMRKDAPLEKWVKDYNRAIKDILTLLENQND